MFSSCEFGLCDSVCVLDSGLLHVFLLLRLVQQGQCDLVGQECLFIALIENLRHLLATGSHVKRPTTEGQIVRASHGVKPFSGCKFQK